MLDDMDIKILALLLENARYQWKEIGEKVHLTGQAVAARIRRLEDMGVIEGYTVKLNPEKTGYAVTAFINVFMKSNDHYAFQDFLKKCKEINEAHRISGGGCYWIKAGVKSNDELGCLLDKILRYANYSISLSIEKIK
ncbi:MAG: Lrp/AsnC family transcriptional regulator [Clostridia bacterium]|nr:Lrp/AsnC family transcriptional regulator [Clostridia bacterium]